ncbi:TIGR01457 family HAD-type hydrolase [Furfurilactobacillus curtus]|uniref:Acid sugar phosphatase n=1 Tax=Furfurilactobacillus curtus TaxID=1746200 RepID=A0ABQ5JN12_9LACO
MSVYDGYLIDLDGTIYQGSREIPSAQKFMAQLIESGRPYLFVTNNSTRSPEAVASNLRQHHHIKTTADHVYTTALATADYLHEQANGQKRSVYMIGEAGLASALRDAGFVIVTDAASHPDFVVVGLDREVTYEKFVQAVLAIQNGATFIATNLDTNIPNQRGMLPGAGAVVDFVRYATGITPISIGKPAEIIMLSALRRLQLGTDQVVMVGDNLHTDILAAQQAHMASILTLTGLSQRSDVKESGIMPTHIVEDLTKWRIEG